MTHNSPISKIPAYSLYGENTEFPDILHCEQICDRAGQHDWMISPHRHLKMHQIFLIESGLASMTIDGSDIVIPAMSVVTVPRNCVHGFVFKAQTNGFVLSIPSDKVATMLSPDSALAEVFGTAKIVPATDNFRRVLETINDEHQSRSFARGSLLRGLLIQLACYLAASEASERQLVNPVHIKITAFESLAHAHFADRWKVSDYAASLGLSTTHLNRLCQEVLGQSPKAYLHGLTIQEAKRLLAYTKIDVASVGYRIGIDDPSYFSRVFMRQTGQSPREFRTLYEVE